MKWRDTKWRDRTRRAGKKAGAGYGWIAFGALLRARDVLPENAGPVLGVYVLKVALPLLILHLLDLNFVQCAGHIFPVTGYKWNG